MTNMHDAMSPEDGSTRLIVESVRDTEGKEAYVSPPIEVILETMGAVTVGRGGAAFRYTTRELGRIGPQRPLEMCF
jgi:hypothetical protein